MKGMINKEIKTKNGILIIIAASLIILGGILLTNIDLIFGAGTGDAGTLDSMDWDGTECSQTDPACNIKAYIDSKSTPCTDDNTGQCYITEETKSALDTDLAAGNIKKDVNIFGVAGSIAANIKCRAGRDASCWSDYCTIGTECGKTCTADGGSTQFSIRTGFVGGVMYVTPTCIWQGAYYSCAGGFGPGVVQCVAF